MQKKKLQKNPVHDHIIIGVDGYFSFLTDAGRYMTVIFIRKFGNHALVISARDMDKKERKQYGK